MNNKYSNLYIKFLQKFIDVKKPIRVVFDCSNGSTGPLLSPLFKTRKPITSKFINSRPDGRFPAHGPNPLLKGKMRQLKKEVIKVKADLGVAFDADGDRAIFVDNYGRQLPSYAFLKLLMIDLPEARIVADLITYKSFELAGFLNKNLYQSKIGSYFMKQAMSRHRAEFGVEDSGHYYFKISDPKLRTPSESTNEPEFYYDSGILAAIKVINAVSRLPYSLGDFYNLLPPVIIKKQIIKTHHPQDVLASFYKKYSKKALSVSKLDGFTFSFKNSWLNVRPSNTEPLVRITFITLKQ